MPTFKKNPNPIMKKSSGFKMKYKHSAFPFKSSPAKINLSFRGLLDPAGVFDKGSGSGRVPPHSHGGGGMSSGPTMGAGGFTGAGTVAGSVVPAVASGAVSENQGMVRGGIMPGLALGGVGRRTTEGQV